MAHTPLDSEAIRKMYVEEKKSAPEIAGILDCSIAGVRQSLLAHGIQLRSRKEAANLRSDRAFLGMAPDRAWCEQAMAAFDWNASACAQHYGYNYQTFVGLLERHGIERNGPRGRQPEPCPFPLDEATQLNLQGETYKDLGARYGLDHRKIFYHLHRAGHVAPRNNMQVYSVPHDERTLDGNKFVLAEELKLERGWRCEICGWDRSIDLAHIKPGKDDGPLVKENILLLCPNHHRAFDSGYLTNDEFSLVRDRVRIAETTFGFVREDYAGW